MTTEDERRVVLHALRLTSLGSVAGLVERTGLAADVVTVTLADAAERRWATERGGRLPGWSLTATGREESERLLAVELDRTSGRESVEVAYRQFLEVNPPFLRLCTEWQLVDIGGTTVPNDHHDIDRDAEVLAELGRLHLVIVELSDDLTTTLERFGGYRPRFEHAMGRLHENDVDWFTKPLIDSYHTVWFELHEDLLATLGRHRSSEHPQRSGMEGRS